MRKLINKMNVSLTRAKFAMEDFLNEERGDTNFISIAIILVVVLVIAVVFVNFGQGLGQSLEGKIQDLNKALND